MATKHKPVCMSIGPYGIDDREKSFRADLEIIFKEALGDEYDYQPYWSLTKIDMPSDIFKGLVSADLVVADLRGLNPNVMYEVGIRHTLNKPILHLVDVDTPLPWDIDKNYTIQYPLPIQVSYKSTFIGEIRERIAKIKTIGKEGSYNTFHRLTKTAVELDTLKGDAGEKDLLRKLFEQMERMQYQLVSLRQDYQKTSYLPSFLREGLKSGRFVLSTADAKWGDWGAGKSNIGAQLLGQDNFPHVKPEQEPGDDEKG